MGFNGAILLRSRALTVHIKGRLTKLCYVNTSRTVIWVLVSDRHAHRHTENVERVENYSA